MNRDEQFKVPKRKVSARRMRIESHPIDVHKGMYSLYLYHNSIISHKNTFHQYCNSFNYSDLHKFLNLIKIIKAQ